MPISFNENPNFEISQTERDSQISSKVLSFYQH
jgi:hypothetical protein